MAALPKILVLHGYTQSAAIFSKRMGAIRKTLAKDAELVFVDAPMILHPVDLANSFGNSNSLEELGAAEASETDPALQPRAWWKQKPDKTGWIGIEESLEILKQMLQKDSYEAVWGFSQGAAMAALLTALLEKPESYPPFLVDGKPPHPPFKYCIAVAGFRSFGPLGAIVFDPPYKTPTLHVLGRTDVIVPEERAKSLLDVSEGKRVVWHEGGHFVPSKGPWRAFFREFIKNPQGGVPAPGESGASAVSTDSAPPSTNASGTATPVPGSATPGGSEAAEAPGAPSASAPSDKSPKLTSVL